MKLFALSLAFMTASAFAATTTTLNCEMSKYPGQVFTFKMENLGKPNMDFGTFGEEENAVVFITKSKKEAVNSLVNTLNGQGGDLRVENDRIHFFGDSAGIDFADLVLWKKTGYKTGYARMDYSFHEILDYSKVSCKLSK